MGFLQFLSILRARKWAALLVFVLVVQIQMCLKCLVLYQMQLYLVELMTHKEPTDSASQIGRAHV